MEGSPNEEHQYESTTCSTAATITFFLALIAGTVSAFFCKAAYETSVEIDGESKLFSKPIMMLLLMFASMIPAIFFWLLQQFFTDPKDRDTLTVKSMIILVIPCVCDLLCTLLLLVAQLYITASMWQMLRGSIICITALLKRFVLNHRLRRHMWIGVAIVTTAMAVVAAVPFLGPAAKDASGAPNNDPRIGVVLVLIGCMAQGIQYVFEEKVMAVDNVPPLVVIGFEGLWGTLLTLTVVYPLAAIIPGKDTGGVFESPADALKLISLSPLLQVRNSFCTTY